MTNDPLADLVRRYPALAEFLKKHPLDLSVLDYPLEEVSAIQAAMLESASHFLESEREDMRVVIRLTVEFFYHLQRVDIDSPSAKDFRYQDDSAFSGIESFVSLCQAYRTTKGETRSTLPQRVMSRSTLKQEFIVMYGKFTSEANFERKCRLLLDLFKLQIVFAGLTYD
jgi:hypothetical protein